MGFRGFARRMARYGRQQSFQETGLPRIAVVDGSNFAHTIYHQTFSHTGIDSYEEYTAKAIEWLDSLGRCGFRIDAIFFDAALPTWKKTERMIRHQEALRRYNVAEHPRPPFIVPALIDALKRSNFAQVTFTVPGEAEGFCIAFAKDVASADRHSEIYIFSDDSDCLIYDTDEQTRVIPLREAEIKSPGGDYKLNVPKVYHPFAIAKSSEMETTDLVKPAFLMVSGHKLSWPTACQRWRDGELQMDADFVDFESQHRTVEEEAIWREMNANPQRDPPQYDPRINELVCQMTPGLERFAFDRLEMHLPVLRDDTRMDSTWTHGEGIRALAYAIMQRGHGRNEGVFEYRRSGSNFVPTEVARMRDREVVAEVDRLVRALWKHADDLSDAGYFRPPERWRHFIMKLTRESLGEAGAEAPDGTQVSQVLGVRPTAPGLHLRHFSAQYQAVFYSLRMLHQSLGLREEAGDALGMGRRALADLEGEMASLPTIPEFFDEIESDAEMKWRWIALL